MGTDIQQVVEGEVVPAAPEPALVLYRPGPLVETATGMVVTAGVDLLTAGVKTLVRALGSWLDRPRHSTSQPAGYWPTPQPSGSGHRARHRWRGGR